ncbi:hypothetical protein C1H46_006051 [Malus baccata]|uniref:Uncharacterized protein n=1 Tax=Malus baccata TaxID=106549 RepID=A0A540NB56_MALBA|nr:hypothetical protein C1H46_006051 [Malus baccata]
MAKEGFWTEKEVKFTAAWLQDLLSVAYGTNCVGAEISLWKVFESVVIFEDSCKQDLAVESYIGPSIQVTSYAVVSSSLLPTSAHIHRYLPKIFDRLKRAEGFLFLQDHTILNYWNLLQAGKTKL